MGVETGELSRDDARDASALWIFILAVCLPPPDCNLTGGNELFQRIEEYRARVGIIVERSQEHTTPNDVSESINGDGSLHFRVGLARAMLPSHSSRSWI